MAMAYKCPIPECPCPDGWMDGWMRTGRTGDDGLHLGLDGVVVEAAALPSIFAVGNNVAPLGVLLCSTQTLQIDL
jgi:hypothetical protein